MSSEDMIDPEFQNEDLFFPTRHQPSFQFLVSRLAPALKNSFLKRVTIDFGDPTGSDTYRGLGRSYLGSAYFLHQAAKATQEVNSWTEKVTNGHIKRILPPMFLDKSTKFVFKNELYLKGQWGEKFDDFHLLDGSSVKVPFMSNMEKQLVSAYDGFKVLALPFKQVQDKGPISLNIFLPNAKDGLQALEDKVVSQHESLKHHLPDQRVEVGDFRIPRFSFGFKTSNALKDLGLVLPFSGEGGMTEMVPYGQDLCGSSKFHESFIEVNEEGVQTAAASVSVIKKREKIDFFADHPFLFLIIEDKTGLVLFSGRVVNLLVSC